MKDPPAPSCSERLCEVPSSSLHQPFGADVRKNIDCREICPTATVVEHRQAAEYMQWALVEGSGFLFPSVLEDREKRELTLTPAQIATNLQAHLWAAGMEDER